MTVYALMDGVEHLLPQIEERDDRNLCRLVRIFRAKPDSYTAQMCLARCEAEMRRRGLDA